MSELYEQAVEAIQAGEEARARQLLAQHLKAEPEHEEGWLALASVLEEGERRRDALERVLALNPENKRARQQLGLDTVESHELPEFEPAAEPPDVPQADPPVPEPVPPAATSPATAEPVWSVEPPEPEPPSEAGAPVGGPVATSVAAGPGADALPLPPPPAGAGDDPVPLALEALFGFFGALGIGWLYAGNLAVGAAAFFGYMLLLLLEMVALVPTLGPLCCLVLPLNLGVVGFSAYKLRAYVRREGNEQNIVYPIVALVFAAILACVLVALLVVAGSFLGISASEIQRGFEVVPSP